MRKPAGRATCKERNDGRSRRKRLPRASVSTVIANNLVECEPFWHGFLEDRAVARADALGLCPPGGDRYGLFGMSGKPGGDGFHVVGPQFAGDIGVQFMLGHR